MTTKARTRILILGIVLWMTGGRIPPAAAANPWAFGAQRTAVFLLDYASDGAQAPAEEWRSAFFEADNSWAAFIREASCGQADLVGDVFGWYSFPAEELREGVWPDLDRVFAAAQADVPDFRAYNKIVFVLHGVQGHAAGVSTFGPIAITTPDGEVAATRCIIWDRLYPWTIDGTRNSTVTHELMHSFGVRGHANTLDCGAAFVGTDLNITRQYAGGDPFDIMGGRWWAAHPNAAFKREIGWLSENEEIVADRSGTHVLYPQERGGPETKLITIPLVQPIPVVADAVAISRYYLEYRFAAGFDERLQALREGHFNAPWPVDTGGILIRGGMLTDGALGTTWLLDAAPESLPEEYGAGGDFVDAFLLPGRSVLDPYNGVRITCGAPREDGGIGVEVKHLADLEITSAVITPIPGRTSSRARLTIRNRLPWNRPVLVAGQRYVYIAFEGLVRDAATGGYTRPRVKPSWNTVMAIMGTALTDLLERGEATVTLSVPNPVNGSFNAMVFMVDPQAGDYQGNAGRVDETDDTNNRIVVNL